MTLTATPFSPMKFTKSVRLQEKFNNLIPGGAHTYAKGDDQFPEGMAPYIVKGKGCRVWDVDGNEYIEYGSGLRAVSLGHAFEPVINAAAAQMQLGSNFVRPATIELECAEEFLSLVEGADKKGISTQAPSVAGIGSNK